MELGQEIHALDRCVFYETHHDWLSVRSTVPSPSHLGPLPLGLVERLLERMPLGSCQLSLLLQLQQLLLQSRQLSVLLRALCLQRRAIRRQLTRDERQRPATQPAHSQYTVQAQAPG